MDEEEVCRQLVNGLSRPLPRPGGPAPSKKASTGPTTTLRHKDRLTEEDAKGTESLWPVRQFVKPVGPEFLIVDEEHPVRCPLLPSPIKIIRRRTLLILWGTVSTFRDHRFLPAM